VRTVPRLLIFCLLIWRFGPQHHKNKKPEGQGRLVTKGLWWPTTMQHLRFSQRSWLDTSLLGFDGLSLGEYFPMFRSIAVPLSSGSICSRRKPLGLLDAENANEDATTRPSTLLACQTACIFTWVCLSTRIHRHKIKTVHITYGLYFMTTSP